MRALWAIVAFTILVAGCSGQEAVAPASVAAPSTEATVTAETGAIEGVALDKDGAALSGASIGLQKDILNLQTNTTPEGRFVFSGLAPGEYKLFVQKLGYESTATKANVTAGEVTKVEVRLVPLKVDPNFPIELTVHQVRTVGVWMPISYAEAMKRMPPGFRPKPHVLLDPNDQVAEYAVYVTSYKNGTMANESLGEGQWAFEVFNVDPAAKHASGYTVDFIVTGSYASDPKLQGVFNIWNLPTSAAQIAFTPGELAASAARATASVKHEKGTYTLSAANGGNTDAAAGTSISVRMFGIVNQNIVNYIDLSLTGALYSIQGAGNVDGAANLAVSPLAPGGESYVQWGPTARQNFVWVEAKK